MDTKVIHPMMLVINASPRRLGVAAFPRLNNFASLQQLGAVVTFLMLNNFASSRRLGVAAFLTLLMRNNFASPQRLGVAAFPRLNNLIHDDNDDATDTNGGSLLTIGHWEGRRSRVRSSERRR
jgi:hypothetical protein